VRQITGTPFRIRTDLAATLFLSQPDEYDGAELVIDDVYGAHAVKLPAGDLVLYPATSLHRVTPVTRGTRLASIFWVQSMVRDVSHRRLLFELDMAIQQVNQVLPNHAAWDGIGGWRICHGFSFAPPLGYDLAYSHTRSAGELSAGGVRCLKGEATASAAGERTWPEKD
jgi:hypothetical protein